MTLLSILAAASGFIMALGNVPQAIKIFRTKSAKDVSITTYTIFLFGAIIWTLYGLEIGNKIVMSVNAFGGLTVLLVMVGWFRYGR